MPDKPCGLQSLVYTPELHVISQEHKPGALRHWRGQHSDSLHAHNIHTLLENIYTYSCEQVKVHLLTFVNINFNTIFDGKMRSAFGVN